jgi:PhoH-like ATPase
MKKIYVLDTSVCLTDADCLTSFENNDIVVPLKVLEEIDHNKKRQDGAGINARKTIRMLDSYREKGSLHKGVRIAKGKGIIQVKGYDVDALPKEYDPATPDNQIIATALTERKQNEKRKVIVVSRDINMRVKCDSIGLLSEDYVEGQIVKDTSYVYTGTTSHLVDEQVIDRFYSKEDVTLEKDEIKLYPNQFVMLVSNSNEKKTALARFVNYSTPLQRVPQKIDGIWGVHPKNKEQAFALDLLMNPEIDIVTLVGKAGSGKTLCAIAAALEQTMNEDSIYKRVIVSRPVQPLGKDIGFLPGTMEEKMSPWLAPIEDNLRFLMGNDKETLQMYMDNGTIEIEALTYIRGRSIADAFIIIDEAQNLTIHELKTIVTRVGEGTKIVLTGDIEQIDNVYTDETSNGLTHAVEKFKNYELSGHIILQKGERSKVATLAAKVL